MKKQILYWVTWFLLIFAMGDIIYTAYDKFMNGRRLEFLEPLGFFGTTFTVSIFTLLLRISCKPFFYSCL